MHAHSNVIVHILNNKRSQLSEIEVRYNIKINFINDNSLLPPLKKIDTIKKTNHKPNMNKPNVKKVKPEVIETKIVTNSEEDENPKKKKRGRRIPKRKKRADEHNTNENNAHFRKNDKQSIDPINLESKQNNEIVQEKTSPKPNNIKKQEIINAEPTAMLENVTKSIKKPKIKKIEKEIIKKDVNVETRKIKTSTPIDVVTVNESSSSKKPKKKGWWST